MSQPRARFPYWKLIIYFALVCFAVSMLFPFFANPYLGDSNRSSNISNAKRLALTAIMYASDHNDTLPFVAPFEFGIDPLKPYQKYGEMHHVDCHPGTPHLKGTSDFRFQFVLNERTTQNSKLVRVLLGPYASLTDTALTVMLISKPIADKGTLIAAFADGHVVPRPPTYWQAMLPPGNDVPLPVPLDRMLFIDPKASELPKYWSIPYEDVERYAEWAKRQKK